MCAHKHINTYIGKGSVFDKRDRALYAKGAYGVTGNYTDLFGSVSRNAEFPSLSKPALLYIELLIETPLLLRQYKTNLVWMHRHYIAAKNGGSPKGINPR